MKVIIDISFETSDDFGFHCTSNIFEWPWGVFPKKGDWIDVDEIEDIVGGFIYKSPESQKAITGNVFSYKRKEFTDIQKTPVLRLYFK